MIQAPLLIDTAINDYFQRINYRKINKNPKLRYLLFLFLNSAFGRYTPGYDVKNIISKYFADEYSLHIEKCSKKISNLLFENLGGVKPIYSAVNYWSPIDHIRRTIINCQCLDNDKDSRSILSYSLAFFMLTYSWAKYGLYSVAHYISEKAFTWRGIIFSYSNYLVSNHNYCNYEIKIPIKYHDKILYESGMYNLVKEFLIDNKDISISNLERLLFDNITFGTIAYKYTREQNGQGFMLKFNPDDILSYFPKSITVFSDKMQKIFKENRIKLEKVFETPISMRNTMFMIISNIMINKLARSFYIYMFPVRVSNTCCVLTIGTKKPLSLEAYLFLNSYSKSIFLFPLIQDFKSYEHIVIEKYGTIISHKLKGASFGLSHLIGKLGKSIKGESKPENDGENREILKNTKWYFSQIEVADLTMSSFASESLPTENNIITTCKSSIEKLKKIFYWIKFTFCSESQDFFIICKKSDIEFCIQEIIYNSAKMFRDNSDQMHAEEVEPEINIKIFIVNDIEEKILKLIDDRKKKYIKAPFLKIEISDNGVGIEENKKEVIFEKGATSKSTTTGKGLYIIKEIIEDGFGGIIYEDGIHKTGAKFNIILRGDK